MHFRMEEKMSKTQPIKDEEMLKNFRNYYRDIEPNPRNYALIVFGLNSALRISDILGLCWNDVYSDQNHRYRDHIAVWEQKTGKENILIVNQHAKEALEYYRKTLLHYHKNDYIFQGQKSGPEPLSRSQAFRIIKKAANYYGFEQNISCHSLRKTFGYFAWKNGTPPALLMSIYNHSSYEITKRYLGIDQLEKDKVFLETFL